MRTEKEGCRGKPRVGVLVMRPYAIRRRCDCFGLTDSGSEEASCMHTYTGFCLVVCLSSCYSAGGAGSGAHVNSDVSAPLREKKSEKQRLLASLSLSLSLSLCAVGGVVGSVEVLVNNKWRLVTPPVPCLRLHLPVVLYTDVPALLLHLFSTSLCHFSSSCSQSEISLRCASVDMVRPPAGRMRCDKSMDLIGSSCSDRGF